MSDFVDRNTRPVLEWDPDNLVAHSLRHSFGQMSTGGKMFVAMYLLGHGAIKLLMVVGLLREKRWVFPVAIVVLLGFIGFQIYRMCGHFSIGLVVFTVLDAVIAALVWNEYRVFRKQSIARARVIPLHQPVSYLLVEYTRMLQARMLLPLPLKS